MSDLKKHLWLPVSVLILIGLGFLVREVRISTDMSFFLSDTPGKQDELLMRHYAQSNGLAMIAIGGVDETARRTASIAVLAALRDMPEVAYASNGGIEMDTALRDVLVDHRYVLGPPISADAFSVEAMRASIQQGLAQLGAATGYAFRDIFPRDPTGRTVAFLRAFGTLNGPPAEAPAGGGLWRDDGGRFLLLALLSARTDDVAVHAAVRETVDAALKNVDSGHAMSAVISGPGFFALDAGERIRAEMQTLTIIAGVGVALLLLWAFRTPGVLVLIALPIAFGVLTGILATATVFGYVHGVAIAFAAVMTGVAVDYPVHLMTLRAAGETPGHAARRIFVPMVLGAGTTFVGFLTLSQSSFPGLAHIGTLSAVAILVAVSFSRYVLPLCLPQRATNTRLGPGLWVFLRDRPRLRRHGRWILWTLPVGLAAVALLTSARLWDDDIRHLSVANAEQVQLDRDLRQVLRLPDVSRFLMIKGDSAAAVLENQWRVTERLRAAKADGEIGGYLSATDFFPPPSEQVRRLDLIPDPDVLRQRLQAATAGLPLDAEVFAPFLSDVARAKAVGAIEIGDLPDLSALSMLALPQSTGDGWIGVVRLVSPVGDIVGTFRNAPGVTPVNLQQLASDVVSRYRVEGLRLMGYGALAGLLVMVVGRRGLRSALKVLATPMIATLTTAAFLVAVGTPLNFFHLLAFVLVVSIGIDYELFFAGYQGDDMTGSHSLNSVALCFGTTLIAFSVLGFSSLPLLHSLGLTVALGVSLSFLLTVLRFKK